MLRSLLVVLAVAFVATLAWSLAPQSPEARPSGTFSAYVVGPADLLHAGDVPVEDADPLRVLLALAERDGFAVVVDDLPRCQHDYVRSVAGHGQTATGGWNYYLRGGDGAWRWAARSASCPGSLRAGDDVLWCWVEPDERCAVYPA